MLDKKEIQKLRAETEDRMIKFLKDGKNKNGFYVDLGNWEAYCKILELW